MLYVLISPHQNSNANHTDRPGGYEGRNGVKMTKVTSEIVNRYVSYCKAYDASICESDYEYVISYYARLELLEEILINDCGITREKLVEIKYLTSKEN